MKPPEIVIVYEESLPADLFDEFGNSLKEEKLNVVVEVRPISGPYAGLEWFLPTAAMVYIGKSYFDGSRVRILRSPPSCRHRKLPRITNILKSMFFLESDSRICNGSKMMENGCAW